MDEYSREEVEQAFRHYWQVGNIEERWSDWADCFTEDVVYVEHVLGNFDGREAVRKWITELMVHNTHVHGALDWYVIEGPRVVYGMDNRYFNPEGPEHPDIEFPGMSQILYGGDGLFRFQEDYWDMKLAKLAYKRFTELRERFGDEHLEDTDARRDARKSW